MKVVQQALKNVGIPVMEGIWRTEDEIQNVGDQYVIYSETTTEAQSADDEPIIYQTFIYMNLWSKFDPTPMRNEIRKRMYAAGFRMIEESNKGYNQPAYNYFTHQYAVQWTWCWFEEVDDGGI